MSANFNFAKCFAPEIADRLNKADNYLYTCLDPVAAIESAGTAMECMSSKALRQISIFH